jgi:thiamine biosynthesis lipoprotein
VTSGDYERYVEIEGIRYAHILDPRTGWPVRGVRSVTVICPDGELADALATSVFVMGREEGLRLIESLQGVEALVVDDVGKIHSSKGLATQLPSAAVNRGEKN